MASLTLNQIKEVKKILVSKLQEIDSKEEQILNSFLVHFDVNNINTIEYYENANKFIDKSRIYIQNRLDKVNNMIATGDYIVETKNSN